MRRHILELTMEQDTRFSYTPPSQHTNSLFKSCSSLKCLPDEQSFQLSRRRDMPPMSCAACAVSQENPRNTQTRTNRRYRIIHLARFCADTRGQQASLSDLSNVLSDHHYD